MDSYYEQQAPNVLIQKAEPKNIHSNVFLQQAKPSNIRANVFLQQAKPSNIRPNVFLHGHGLIHGLNYDHTKHPPDKTPIGLWFSAIIFVLGLTILMAISLYHCCDLFATPEICNKPPISILGVTGDYIHEVSLDKLPPEIVNKSVSNTKLVKTLPEAIKCKRRKHRRYKPPKNPYANKG
jgi:hypothetical protein